MDQKLHNFAQPPDHLSATVKEWWRQVVEDYALEPHHLKLLQLACEAWDSAQLARAVLGIAGTTYTDRWGQPKARPEVAIERDSRIAFARLLREMGLESAPDESPRPPALKR
mgnify:CR=1 FL=1